jgi:uncharacterized protein (TIGR02231 family)
MKKILFCLITLINISAFAQEKEIYVKSNIEEVTVFLSGAAIKRTAKDLNIEKGRTTLYFEGLSDNINTNSIQATAKQGIKIISISSVLNYQFKIPAYSAEKETKLRDSLELFNDKLYILATEKAVFEEEKKLLLANQGRIGASGGVNTNELQLAADFYRNRLNEINKKVYDIVQTEKKTKKTVDKLNQSLVQLTKTRTSYTIVVTIAAENPVNNVDMDITYIANQASWLPQYDMRAVGVGEKIQFTYRGEIFNTTNEDWEKVKLTLSSADPTLSAAYPTLTAWRLNFYQPMYQQQEMAYNKKQDMPRMQQSNNNVLYEQDEAAGGSISRAVTEESAIIEVSELGVDFQIKEIYTIPSDGRGHLVDINEYKLTADYNYLCVPKLDKDAFLMAKIAGWESLNLIEGAVNIYFKDTYVGQSYISPRYTKDTLSVSLGRDKKVVVTRALKKDYNSVRFIGSSRTEQFIYDINIRNSNATAVNIEIQDQVPISQENDIEVSVDEISNAEHNKETGILVWKFNLPQSEVKKITLGYSVKYPKSKTVNLRPSKSKVIQKR